MPRGRGIGITGDGNPWSRPTPETPATGNVGLALLVTPVAQLFCARSGSHHIWARLTTRLRATITSTPLVLPRSLRPAVDAGGDPATSLCSAGADVLGLTGAGIMLLSGSRLDCVAASDTATSDIEALELMIGEGPCLDAFHTRPACFDENLADNRQWGAFREAASKVGVRAVFGFPVVVADVCIGVLNCHRDTSGRLTETRSPTRSSLRGLGAQHRVVAGREAAHRADFGQLEESGIHRVVVHQAAGRVSVQANVSVSDAMALMGRTPSARQHTPRDLEPDPGRTVAFRCLTARSTQYVD